MTIAEYIECKSKIIGKIATYDLLITKMEEAILTGAVSGHLVQYELDDGQIKCRAQYRNIGTMVEAMTGLQRLRQMYINQFNGRGTRMVGGNLY